MANEGNVPIPTSNDINNINSLTSIGQSNIYGISTNDNPKQPRIDASTERLLVQTALQSALNNNDYLNVEIQKDSSAGAATNIASFGGEDQSAVDVAARINALTDALATNATDTLRISAPSTLDVDIAAASAGTLQTEQQSPVGVEDSQGGQIDPLARQDTSPVTASTTAAATDVTLSLGDYRKDVDIFVNTSGAATLTVEVRTDGGTWRTLDTIDYTSATTEIEQYNTAFAEIRASLDANVNALEASSKGI